MEARSSEGEVSIGPSVDVRPQPELSLNEQVFGQVNPALGSLLFILIMQSYLPSCCLCLEQQSLQVVRKK